MCAYKDIEQLNVNYIKAGDSINVNDSSSGVYFEDVVQLSGSRLIDGSITYSGNGDGTINVYIVPLRWDGKYTAGEQFYLNIIENTELVEINSGDDHEVIKYIKLVDF